MLPFIVLLLAIVSGGVYYYLRTQDIAQQSVRVEESLGVQDNAGNNPGQNPLNTNTEPASENQPAQSSNTSSQASAYGPVLSENDLLALADDKYSSGLVPLGDYKYVTSGPKKGYIYLCNVRKDNPGSAVNGPWMHGTAWNFLEKISIQGSVSWPNAIFSNVISGIMRLLKGNDLPISHNTGTFPVQSSDPAHAYDANPNNISAQSYSLSIPANPTYSATPYCMGMEVGVMLSGVPIFNGFDAGLRDAQAHELQDSCEGHPQGDGEYHYHGLSSCMKDTSEATVLGYAFDGFPITGPKVADKKYLTTEDLDECHGITSEIIMDGKKKVTYHYVMTQDFPYSASCFRGKAVVMKLDTGTTGGTQSGQSSGMQTQNQVQGSGDHASPPQQAIDACSGKYSGASCSFSTPNGTISGSCDTPPGSSLACIPQ